MMEIEVPEDSVVISDGKVQTHIKHKESKRDERVAIYTDRISACDERLPFGITNKGKILLWSTIFFKRKFENIVENDIVSFDQSYAMASGGINKNSEIYRNRVLLIREVVQIPVECIAREYLVGSLFAEYSKDSSFALGHTLPRGMKEYDKLGVPIFTPSIKNKTGHDTNITYNELISFLREWLDREENRKFKIDAQLLAQLLRSTTLAIFSAGSKFFDEKGAILADWKGEFGLYINDKGETIFVWSDEGITPDTSRVWLKESYGEGKIPIGLDKDPVRKHKKKGDVPFEVQLETIRIYRTFSEMLLPPEYLEKIYEEPCR
ncbi:MAG: phosphoribosylaminoimidazolesuccinocarboxamide synthase [Candidatus Paceibacterota bacterium]